MEETHLIDFKEYIADGEREPGYPAAYETFEGVTYLEALEEAFEGERIPADPEDAGWREVIDPAAFRRAENQ